MVEYQWNEDKNRELEETRGINFEDILGVVETGKVIEVIDHPNQRKYPKQKILFVEIRDYIIAVPFVERGQVRFLKTLYKSRVATKRYLKKGKI